MDDLLENKIINGIGGVGVYFVEHLDNKLLASIKARLNRTVIGIFCSNGERLTIEVKGCAADKESLIHDLASFNLECDRMENMRPDATIDSEKFLRCLFAEDSDLSRKYVVLVDASILGHRLIDNDGSMICLRVAQ